MLVTRYYISIPDASYGEKFWNGKGFTFLIDDCKVYVSKSAAKQRLIKLVNSGAYAGIELKESRYSL